MRNAGLPAAATYGTCAARESSHEVKALTLERGKPCCHDYRVSGLSFPCVITQLARTLPRHFSTFSGLPASQPRGRTLDEGSPRLLIHTQLITISCAPASFPLSPLSPYSDIPALLDNHFSFPSLPGAERRARLVICIKHRFFFFPSLSLFLSFLPPPPTSK